MSSLNEYIGVVAKVFFLNFLIRTMQQTTIS